MHSLIGGRQLLHIPPPLIFTLSSVGFSCHPVPDWSLLRVEDGQKTSVLGSFSSPLIIHSVISPVIHFTWMSLCADIRGFLFSTCPPATSELVEEKKRSVFFNLSSVSSFVSNSPPTWTVPRVKYLLIKNPHAFSWVVFCVEKNQNMFSVGTLFSRHSTKFHISISVSRCRPNMIMMCLLACRWEPLIWFAGCGFAASYWLQPHL